MKKALSIFLCLAMLWTALPLSVFAEDGDAPAQAAAEESYRKKITETYTRLRAGIPSASPAPGKTELADVRIGEEKENAAGKRYTEILGSYRSYPQYTGTEGSGAAARFYYEAVRQKTETAAAETHFDVWHYTGGYWAIGAKRTQVQDSALQSYGSITKYLESVYSDDTTLSVSFEIPEKAKAAAAKGALKSVCVYQEHNLPIYSGELAYSMPKAGNGDISQGTF